MHLASDLAIKKSERQTWIPVAITEDMEAKPVEYHGTANIKALCKANGLIGIDKGVIRLDKGTMVKVRLI
jgi:molybdopterin biosynthesis enzyme